MYSMGHLVRGGGRRDGASGFLTTFVMLVAILQNFGISGVAATYYNNCSTVTVTKTVGDSNPYPAHEKTVTKTVTTTVPTITTETTTYTKTVPVPTTIISTTTYTEKGPGVRTTTKTTTETATKTVYVTDSGDYGGYGDYGKTTVTRTVTK